MGKLLIEYFGVCGHGNNINVYLFYSDGRKWLLKLSKHRLDARSNMDLEVDFYRAILKPENLEKKFTLEAQERTNNSNYIHTNTTPSPGIG